MSIAVLIGVHDGIVLASDSASTLSVLPNQQIQPPPGATLVLNVYDNANKIFNIIKGQPIGCVTFGSGSIGNASVATLIKDLRAKLSKPEEAKKYNFDIRNYTMETVVNVLGQFVSEELNRLDEPHRAAITLGFLVGGYSVGKPLGESWSVEFVGGVLKKPAKLRKDDEPGISWGGLGEVLQRIVLGFSPTLYELLGTVSKPPQPPEAIAQQLGPLFTNRLQAPMVFAPMPIQDAIDLARFLVHAAIMYSRFTPGPKVVGGPIEIATITKHEQFKWISRKHYYESTLNKEPSHVIVD